MKVRVMAPTIAMITPEAAYGKSLEVSFRRPPGAQGLILPGGRVVLAPVIVKVRVERTPGWIEMASLEWRVVGIILDGEGNTNDHWSITGHHDFYRPGEWIAIECTKERIKVATSADIQKLKAMGGIN